MKNYKYKVIASVLIATFAMTFLWPVTPAWAAPTPSIPALVSPASNTLLTTLTPTLQWSVSTPAVDLAFYDLEIATDRYFAMVIDSQTFAAGTNTYPVPGGTLVQATTYYWHVRSTNAIAETRGWSAYRYFRTKIDPPTLISPADHATLNYNRPDFDWTDVLGASNYSLQVARDNGFTALVLSITATDSEYTPTADLTANVPLFWRVRTNNTTYGPSDWTPYFKIDLMANPPSIPVLLQPAKDKLTDDHTPLLVWNKSTLPSGEIFSQYEVEIYILDAANNIVVVLTDTVIGDIDLCEYDIQLADELDPATTYYWRVRSYNTDGDYSAYPSAFTLRTSLEAATLISPLDTTILADNRPTFDWTDVPSASSYTLSVAPNTAFLSPVLVAQSLASEYTPRLNLPPGVTLYWRVVANHVLYGPGLKSETWSLDTANPPGVPRLLSPLINALLTNYTPRLDWAQSTLPLLTTFQYYHVQIATDPTFVAIVDDATTNPFDIYNHEYTPLVPLSSTSKYYWHVQACNTAIPTQCSAWSQTWYFRTAVDVPIQNNPADLFSSNNHRPAFDWTAVTGASSYTLQISRRATLQNAYSMVLTITAINYTPTFDLFAGEHSTFYWRVRANSPTNGPGAWSTVWSFTVTP